jgi:phage shock protein PspC (stress-responsive transcriptional regulator)
MQVNPRRLYRSRDRQLAGVAGGMAEYLEIDPTVVRILWIIVGIASGGLALIAYIILALVIPPAPWAAAPGPGGWSTPGAPAGWSGAPSETPSSAPSGTAGWSAPPSAPGWNPQWSPAPQPAAPRRADTRGLGAAAIIGVVLIVFGAVALADAALPGWAFGAILGPAVILALGAALLVSSVRRRDQEAPIAPGAPAPSDAAGTMPVDPS